MDQTETHLNRIVELGFLRRMKAVAAHHGRQSTAFEVRRILKAFVDAQWLADFDTRLAAYQLQLGMTSGDAADE